MFVCHVLRQSIEAAARRENGRDEGERERCEGKRIRTISNKRIIQGLPPTAGVVLRCCALLCLIRPVRLSSFLLPSHRPKCASHTRPPNPTLPLHTTTLPPKKTKHTNKSHASMPSYCTYKNKPHLPSLPTNHSTLRRLAALLGTGPLQSGAEGPLPSSLPPYAPLPPFPAPAPVPAVVNSCSFQSGAASVATKREAAVSVPSGCE